MMRMAELVAERGTCDRLQVGALIVRDSRVISTGYNGNVAGQAHCKHWGMDGQLEEGPCTTAVHAETNALIYAARHGVAVDSAELWTTHQPCLACANLIINAGITRVYFAKPYRLYDGLAALQRSGVTVFRVTEDYSLVQTIRL